jgi:ABC-2 type transport system permease protein
MKVLDIARKDFIRSFRTAFVLVMMFVVPLLITGLIYFAFGGFVKEGASFSLPKTRVRVVNLDRPDPRFGFAAGKILAGFLQSGALNDIMEVKEETDDRAARAAIESRQADAAVIIPVNFTAAAENPDEKAEVKVIHDPARTVGPRIVQGVVGGFVDAFNGAKIAAAVAVRQRQSRGLQVDPGELETIARQYAGWAQSQGYGPGQGAAAQALSIRSPRVEKSAASPFTVFLGPVMAGMMVFFVFFTGAATAQSIIEEDEEGTLARLSTTPTPQAAILGGKFASGFLTIIVQIAVLLAASALLFRIHWGQPLTVLLASAGLVVAAAGFGVFVMSFMKTARQAGHIMGVVFTVTGILGGLIPLGDPSRPSPLEPFNLALPQGLAMRAWKQALAGAGAESVLVPLLLLLAEGAVLFLIGTQVFRKRFQ